MQLPFNPEPNNLYARDTSQKFIRSTSITKQHSAKNNKMRRSVPQSQLNMMRETTDSVYDIMGECDDPHAMRLMF